MYPSIRCIRCDALLLSNRGVGGDRRDPHLPGAIEAVAQQVASGAARLLCLCAVATYIGRCIHSCWQARLGIGFACSVLFRLKAEVHVVGVDGSAGGGEERLPEWHIQRRSQSRGPQPAALQVQLPPATRFPQPHSSPAKPAAVLPARHRHSRAR